MEKLIEEIESYAAKVGKHPSTIIQIGGKCGGKSWAKWQNGETCTMKIASRIRKFMEDNPI